MKKVFDEVKFAHISFKNHIARSATNDYAGNDDGTVSDLQMEINRLLAEGEVGMILTGHYAVCPGGRNDPKQNGLWDDSFIPGHKALTDMVHEKGAKIIAQLNHSGGKAQKAAIVAQAVAPSVVEIMPGIIPRALTAAEIHEIQEQFAQAALRAKKAGYDGVQVHCAHGYLLSQFIDPAHNKREDEYGGCGENRFRMAAETIQKVRALVGEAYPVFLKINSNVAEDDDAFADELVEMMKTAKALGIEAAEISGCDFNKKKPAERLYYLERAKRVRMEADVPVILVGGVRTIEEMQQVLDEGMDMVALSRPFICQPDIILRLKAGETSKCIGCYGCFTSFQKTGKRCVLHK